MATPVYNGNSNNLTGKGSPNPQKLTIPMLDQVQDPAVSAALLRIQQFLNNLVAPSSGGTSYASLTGPGQTVTPGALTQLGNFSVSVSAASSGADVNFTVTNGTAVSIVDIGSGGNIAVTAIGGKITLTPDVAMFIGSSSSVTEVKGASVFIQTNAGALLKFYSLTGGVAQQTVTGSRAGNAALTSLLNAMALLGLVIDSSTP